MKQVTHSRHDVEAALADYVAAEDALRAFTDRNFGRMCATCARWTLLATKANAQAAAASADSNGREAAAGAASRPPSEVGWRLSSWVTNCCNANHALESMSDASLAGIVASREEGERWWEHAHRSASAPCAALTDQGCALKRGRPELCNTYFCEAVRDYLWLVGGERHGPQLASMLDELQRRWSRLYGRYQQAILDTRLSGSTPDPGRLRRETEWHRFFALLDTFDRALSRHERPVSAPEVADRLFKVKGDRDLFVPFFEGEVAAIDGRIRRPSAGSSVEP